MAKNKSPHASKLDLIWTRPDKPAREPALNREQITRTAIRVADAEGLDAITMRRIAQELSVSPMALYYHVPTKNDLLDLMMDAAFGEMKFPDKPSGDWRADLWFAAHQARDMGRRHLWLMTLLGERPPLGPNFLHHLEFFLAVLEGCGLTITVMSDIANSVENYVFGFVLNEARQETMKRHSGLSDEEWNAAIAPHLERLILTGRYPTAARLLKEESATEPDHGFDFGLECLLNGIAAKITSDL